METLMLSEERPKGAAKGGNEHPAELINKLLGKFLRNWYWFLVSLIVCVGISTIYLRYAVPVYNIECRFMIKRPNPSGSQQELITQLDGGDNGGDVQDEIEVIRTKMLMKRVVHSLQLNVSTFSKGNIKSTELYKTAPFRINLLQMNDSAVGHAWTVTLDPMTKQPIVTNEAGPASIKWGDTVKTNAIEFTIDSNRSVFPQNGAYLVLIRPEDALAMECLGRVTLAPVADGMNIIKMSITDPLPSRGADILNDLYQQYVNANIEDQGALADKTIKFIENRLAIVTNELSGVEKNIEEFKSSNNVVDISQQSNLAQANANDLQKQQIQQDVQLEVLSSIEGLLKEDAFRVVPVSLVTQSPAYNSLAEKFNALIQQRDALLGTSKPGNPVVLQLNDRISVARNDLRTELENIKRELMINKADLGQRISQSMSVIKGIPAKQRAFLEISRQQEVKQQLYLFLLQKREETAISRSGTLSNSRLIDPARPDMQPISPNRRNIYLVGLALGLLIPASGIYLKEFLNNKITDRKEIEERTGAPILGEIGHNNGESTLVVIDDSRSFIAEQFRALRTNLSFLLTGKQHQVILVTSSMSGEGKSFISLNLASSLAISGKKVVLLELDLRKPRLSQQLNMPNEQGFTNYIVSNTDLKYLPKRVPTHPNLFIINSGPIPPNPAELLLQDKVKTLFDYLYSNFDYIVIDTPPVGLVTDALLVGKFADACIYVTRQGYTFRQQIAIVEDLFSGRKLKGLSVLINDVDTKKKSGYRYGYSYGNGAYYSDSENSNGRPQWLNGRKKKHTPTKPGSDA